MFTLRSITAALDAWRRGDSEAGTAVWNWAYPRLRASARGLLGASARRGTMQPTQLVNEAFLRLVRQSKKSFRGSQHFVHVCRKFMLRALLDALRRERRQRRGGGRQIEALSEEVAAARSADPIERLALEEALAKLAQRGAGEATAARLVQMRFFGGLAEEEAAAALGISRSVASHLWLYARSWLARELKHGV